MPHRVAAELYVLEHPRDGCRGDDVEALSIAIVSMAIVSMAIVSMAIVTMAILR